MADVATAVEVTVRYFAAAKAAAGSETARVTVPPGATLNDLIATLGRDNADLAKVLVRCSFLRDGVAVRDHAQRLAPGVTVDVLPPYAGG